MKDEFFLFPARFFISPARSFQLTIRGDRRAIARSRLRYNRRVQRSVRRNLGRLAAWIANWITRINERCATHISPATSAIQPPDVYRARSTYKATADECSIDSPVKGNLSWPPVHDADPRLCTVRSYIDEDYTAFGYLEVMQSPWWKYTGCVGSN